MEAQRAIEQVYYSHQIDARLPFDQAVPQELLERKVRDYLRQSAALEQRWGAPITAAMLRAETLRIAQSTRMPERLLELYAALGNDPVLIQECLARPAFADRLARARFEAEADSMPHTVDAGAQDSAARTPGNLVPKRSWSEWWRDAGPAFDTASVHTVATAADLIPQSQSAGCPHGWDRSGALAPYDERSHHTAVWTGSRMIVWGGVAYGIQPLNTGVQYDPATDTSTPISTSGAPSGRYYHTAIWTGSRMIVWGGEYGDPTATGGSYDPASDIWSPVSTSAAPSARSGHSAVWTGSLMLIWGGGSSAGLESSGYRYDPQTDLWSPMSGSQAPTARAGHTAVWAANRMIVWAGTAGALYDPALDTWSPTSSLNAPTFRAGHTAVWAANRMIVWGGSDTPTGALYDPALDTWSPTSLINAPSARNGHTAVVGAGGMIIWGGWGYQGGLVGVLGTGGRYDPVSNAWSPTQASGAPPGRARHTAVWTGSQMIVWGGHGLGAQTPLSSGSAYGRYDPVADAWVTSTYVAQPTTSPGLWTGSLMIIGSGTHSAYSTHPPLERYDPALDLWTPATTTSAPAGGSPGSGPAVWTGQEVIVQAGRYDPAADTWSAISTVDAPLFGNIGLWTGSEMLLWGRGIGGRYDPHTDTWTPISQTGAPPRGIGVWSGTHMIVLGGSRQSGFIGGRYDPKTDSWAPLSTINAPEPRDAFQVVWANGRMVMAGGYYDYCDSPKDEPCQCCAYWDWYRKYPTSAGIYDPVGDAWTQVFAPRGGQEMSAVSAGDEAIFWGGAYCAALGLCDSYLLPGRIGSVNMNKGFRVNPQAGTVTPMSTLNAPTPRANSAAVWTGQEMIVWGGVAYHFSLDLSALPRDGGRFSVGEPGPDADGDGFDTNCDCDDTQVSVHPSGTQICGDGLNNDCRDPGWPALAGTNEADDDADGVTECQGDCNDASAAMRPGAAEVCDGLDNDCDTQVDEGVGVDADGDGFTTCGDCDDSQASVYPGAPQVCDGLNNDCLDPCWPALAGTNEADDDADGYSECQGDCSDFDPSVNPDALELCDAVDNDCDGFVDSDNDADGDGQSACAGDCQPANPSIYVGAPQVCDGLNNDCLHPSWPAIAGTNEGDDDADGYSECQGDCADFDPSRNPDALEVCDGFDNDCDGLVDNDNDADGDGQSTCAGDCQPANPAVYAGAPQVCDGVNNDCATFNWPQLAFTTESDDDADGFSECQQDCNDTDGSVWTAPSEPIDLGLSYDVATGETSLSWSPPAQMGGSVVYYDVMRTRNRSNFVSPTVCQEFNDAGDTVSIDTVVPIAGTGFFYLVRAENQCPGSSRAGSDSNGVAIPARSCP